MTEQISGVLSKAVKSVYTIGLQKPVKRKAELVGLKRVTTPSNKLGTVLSRLTNRNSRAEFHGGSGERLASALEFRDGVLKKVAIQLPVGKNDGRVHLNFREIEETGPKGKLPIVDINELEKVVKGNGLSLNLSERNKGKSSVTGKKGEKIATIFWRTQTSKGDKGIPCEVVVEGSPDMVESRLAKIIDERAWSLKAKHQLRIA